MSQKRDMGAPTSSANLVPAGYNPWRYVQLAAILMLHRMQRDVTFARVEVVAGIVKDKVIPLRVSGRARRSGFHRRWRTTDDEVDGDILPAIRACG